MLEISNTKRKSIEIKDGIDRLPYHHIIIYEIHYINFYIENNGNDDVVLQIRNKIIDEPYEPIYTLNTSSKVYTEVLNYLKLRTLELTSLIQYNAVEYYDNKIKGLFKIINDISNAIRENDNKTNDVAKIKAKISFIEINKPKLVEDFIKNANLLLQTGGNTLWKMSATKERQIIPGNKRSSVIYVRVLLNSKFGQTKYVKCAKSKNGYKTLKSAMKSSS